MKQEHIDQITAGAKALNIYRLQVEPIGDSLFLTIPDGYLFGHQLEELMRLARIGEYAFSIRSQGLMLICEVRGGWVKTK